MRTNWAVSTKLTKYSGEMNCRLGLQVYSPGGHSRRVSYRSEERVTIKIFELLPQLVMFNSFDWTHQVFRITILDHTSFRSIFIDGVQ